MERDVIDESPCSSIAVDSVLRMGATGVIWGLCAGPYDAKQQGLTGIARASFVAKSVAQHGFQWGLFAAIFSFTNCGLQRYRRRKDWLNSLAAGVIAGAAYGAGTRNWKQAAAVTGLICASCQVFDESRSA